MKDISQPAMVSPSARRVKQFAVLFWWMLTFRLPSKLRAYYRQTETFSRMNDEVQVRLTYLLHDWLQHKEGTVFAMPPTLAGALREKYLTETGLTDEAARTWSTLLTGHACHPSAIQTLNTVVNCVRESERIAALTYEVLGSPFFNATYYRDRHGHQGTDAEMAIHYLLIGELLGLAPSEDFDPAYYGEQNADVSLSGMVRLLHYTAFGLTEGRCAHQAPEPVADEDTPDAMQISLAKAVERWLKALHDQRRDASPILSAELLTPYLREIGLKDGPLTSWHKVLFNQSAVDAIEYADIASLVATALISNATFDFSTISVLQSAEFDPTFYRAQASLIDTDLNAARHYLLIGEPLGIAPSLTFEPSFYAGKYLDVTESGMNCLLHYAQLGKIEGRIACLLQDDTLSPHSLIDVNSPIHVNSGIDVDSGIDKDQEAQDPGALAFADAIEGWLSELRDLRDDALPIFSPEMLTLYLQGLGLHAETLALFKATVFEQPVVDATNHRAIAEQVANALSRGTIFDTLVDHVCHCLEFDGNYYRARASLTDANTNVRAAQHYLLIGEPLGIRPSSAFDPSYYAGYNTDVANAGMSLLLHYVQAGKNEGRRAHGLSSRHTQHQPLDASRENIIVVVHETSRTGAPILGWNIIETLSKKYNVHTIYLGDGALTSAFEQLSTETYGPFEGSRTLTANLAKVLQPLFTAKSFKYAILNSIESRPALAICSRYSVPTLLLVHEFGSYVSPAQSLIDALEATTEVVFPAQIVADSSIAVYPALRRRGYRIEPQGMSRIPNSVNQALVRLPHEIGVLQRAREAGAFIVIGAGSVSLRKGVDLFISAASYTQNLELKRRVHFVWVGGGYHPDKDMGYSIYLKEQIDRSKLHEHVTLLDEMADLDAIYALADVFLLSSRLDPLPNVSIDALCRGIPTICFKDASGTADLMLTDHDTAAYVAEYLDAKGAADLIGRLASDDELHKRLSKSTRELGNRLFDMERYVQRLDVMASAMADEQFGSQTPHMIRPLANMFNQDQGLALSSALVK